MRGPSSANTLGNGRMLGVYLEGVAQGDNVGMEHGSQHIPLGTDVTAMVFRKNLVFPHDLHGINGACVPLAHLKHLEGPATTFTRSHAAFLNCEPQTNTLSG